MESEQDFWERPDVVAQFAERAPDHRLMPLLDEYDDPATVRVLDLGCAGGRNTVPLAERGFDVHAMDGSTGMVEATRARLAEVLGAQEAARRVTVGHMDDLSRYAAESFDLVVALGILQNAPTWAEWQRATAEVARVLRSGGRLLVAHFSPATDPTGRGVTPVPGQPHVFDGLTAGRMTLLDVDELDREVARFGLQPEVPTATGTTRLEHGRRVSVNALYRKR